MTLITHDHRQGRLEQASVDGRRDARSAAPGGFLRGIGGTAFAAIIDQPAYHAHPRAAADCMVRQLLDEARTLAAWIKHFGPAASGPDLTAKILTAITELRAAKDECEMAEWRPARPPATGPIHLRRGDSYFVAQISASDGALLGLTPQVRRLAEAGVIARDSDGRWRSQIVGREIIVVDDGTIGGRA